ncbi:ABC transporter permease [Mesorhizobium sp. SP-1A]|uniref:ABC transporter permease n=1 Tax=Mesorhizobium sp. SP-1A TaxID=3077840 RepID=UPI0028F6DB64|nr:ABC transporter permease [Mesorhizobium sp. SP-1A]
MRIAPGTMRLLIVAAIFGAWELLPRALDLPLVLLPPLSTSLDAGVENRLVFFQHFGVTLGEVAIAVLIACGLGLIAGMLVGVSQARARKIAPLASTLYAIPIVMLYPLFTVWLGIGSSSKIAFGAFYGFVPTFLTTVAGVATIPDYYRTVARSYAATPAQQILRILIPAAIPTVLSGIRLGGALAIVGVIAAEMLTSTAGLGFLISQFRTSLETPAVYFSVLCVIFLVVAFEVAMYGLDLVCQQRWAPWKRDRTGTSDPAQLAVT